VIVHRLDRRQQLDHPIDAVFAFRHQAEQRHLEQR
jgi:hypothetical protein